MRSDLFTDEPAPQAPDELFTDEPAPGTEPMTFKGFGENVGSDVKGLGTGLLEMGKMVVDPLNITGAIKAGSFDPIKEAPLKNWEMLKSIPGGLVEEGKRIGIGELATGHPIEAAKKFGRAAYEKPLTTGLDISPVAGMAGKALGIGGKAARGAGLAAEAGEAADLAGAAGKAGEIAAGVGKAEKLAPELKGSVGKIEPYLSKQFGESSKAGEIPLAQKSTAPSAPKLTGNLADDARVIEEHVKKHTQPELDSILKSIADEHGVEFKGVAKSAKSIEEKVVRKNASGNKDYNIYSEKDLARGVIIGDDFSKFPDIIKSLKSRGFSIEDTINAKEPLNLFGYRGLHSSAKLGGGFQGEIQLHTPASWKFKETVSDAIYRKWRNYSGDQIKDLSRQQLYSYWNDVKTTSDFWNNYAGSIPEDIRASISGAAKGTESVTAPNLRSPLMGAQELPASSFQSSLSNQTMRPSASRETMGREASIKSPPNNESLQQQVGKSQPNFETPKTPGEIDPFSKTKAAAEELTSKIPPIAKGPLDEAMNFAKDKYGDVIKKTGIPKAADTASKYLIDIGRDFTAKQLGAKFGQLKKLSKNIGVDATEELMDYAQERGYVSPKTGSIGMYEKVLADQADAGATVGGMRKLAAERGAAHNMPALLEEIQIKFARKYGKGMHSGEGSTFEKALEEIDDVQPTADAVAEKISALFSQSKNLDKLKQPSGAYADVARELRAANEALLAKYLNPQELAFYKKSLSDYGKTTQIREFVTGKKLSDMGGRLPPGSGILRRGFQKGLDVIGYKVGAKLAKDMGEWIAKNPEKIAHPKEIFSHLVDEAVEMMDDFGNPLD